jgi:hypothetical protein
MLQARPRGFSRENRNRCGGCALTVLAFGIQATAGIVSGLLGQSVFNAGPLSLRLPVIDTVEPISSVVLGAAVFDQRLASSSGPLALQFVGGAIAATALFARRGHIADVTSRLSCR